MLRRGYRGARGCEIRVSGYWVQSTTWGWVMRDIIGRRCDRGATSLRSMTVWCRVFRLVRCAVKRRRRSFTSDCECEIHKNTKEE